MSSLAYIRDQYKVPAYRGRRVKVYNEKNGTITGASGPYIRVRLDGEARIGSYHPTWRVQYLPGGEGTGSNGRFV
jgi:hypothetical protein